LCPFIYVLKLQNRCVTCVTGVGSSNHETVNRFFQTFHAMGINVDEGARPSDNMDRDGQEKHPVSPKSPMSLPASMELSPKSSMLSLPAAVELEIVTEAASIAELLERDAAQRDAEAPGASIVIVGGAGGYS